MARRKSNQDSVRNIQRTKSSYYVTLPAGIMREFGWKERQKVVIRKYGKNRVVIADWKK